MARCEDCLGRTPYASLTATIVMCLGVGLFCGTGFRAVELTRAGIFEALFNINLPWLQNIQIIFLLFGIIMGLFAILLLTFGFMSTGRTRDVLCEGVRCIRGGKTCAVLLLLVTSLMHIAWMGITSFCAIPIIIYLMVRSICNNEIVQRDWWYLDNTCLNLSRFGIYDNITHGMDLHALCDEIEMSQFCQQVYDAGPMYCFAYGGAFLIVLGLVSYLIALGSGFSRIKTHRDLTELKNAINVSVEELRMNQSSSWGQ